MSGAIFERHEMKFLLNMKQRRFLENAIQGRMRPDEHGESTICNIYYDTPDYLLVRRSLEGPVYKEKIRMRSYGPAYGSDSVFLELKKKYKGVVYKRRISIPLDEAEAYMHHRIPMPSDSQIGREIDWFCHSYGDLIPAAHISYDRNAWFDRFDPELRTCPLPWTRRASRACSLSALPCGHSIIGAGESLLEIKTASSIPMWLVSLLDEAEIRKTSFSKYGSAYMAMLADYRMRGVFCA